MPDERFFVRCLQMSELCFMGIRDAVIQALHDPGLPTCREKASALRQATAFADLLLSILRLLHTLTREDFLRFRELTGNSSAVQSFNYQSMELVLYGPSETKARLLAGSAHYASLLAATDPAGATCLAGYLREVEQRAPDAGAAEFLAWARKLDRRLLGWRTFHLRIAAAYVPPGKMGTGGTEGVPYLRHVLQKRLFPDSVADESAAPGAGEPAR
jgi:tryptophan 2,3-dioxygenase